MPRLIKCSVLGCMRTRMARGWCGAHYANWLRHGTPILKKPTAEERFWVKVDKDGPIHLAHGQCWIWTGGKDYDGYGFIKVKRRQTRSHKYSWTLRHGEIEPGLLILHKCDNPSCVNPDHLFLGTCQDNHDDCGEKGRRAVGELNGSSVLTEEIVLSLRREYIPGCRVRGTVGLAKKYGISQSAVWCVVNGKRWKHV